MTKKISIIGKGTAGCLTALRFTNLGYEVEWYYDSTIPAASVGEGSDLSLPTFLFENTSLNYGNLDLIDGYYKEGIRKDNWGGKDFTHWFNLGQMSLHFNANKFQSYTQNLLQDIITDKKVNPEDLDSDYILDCTGSPIIDDKFIKAKYIPVNSAYIMQCPWDYPKFNQSLCIARPYGWVFGIPLKNRCSIGYIFNKDITDVDIIKEDIEEIFTIFKLTPNRDIQPRIINFNNYYRKINFTDRMSYNGNASFFLEPIEATSIGTSIRNIQLSEGIITKDFTPEDQNSKFHNFMKETQDVIALHYLSGSKWKNEFWDRAQSMAQDCFKNTFSTYPKSKLILGSEDIRYSTWGISSLKQNIKGLDLHNILTEIQNG